MNALAHKAARTSRLPPDHRRRIHHPRLPPAREPGATLRRASTQHARRPVTRWMVNDSSSACYHREVDKTRCDPPQRYPPRSRAHTLAFAMIDRPFTRRDPQPLLDLATRWSSCNPPIASPSLPRPTRADSPAACPAGLRILPYPTLQERARPADFTTLQPSCFQHAATVHSQPPPRIYTTTEDLS